MTLQILLCHNTGVSRERAEQLGSQLKAYYSKHTPITAEIDYRQVDLPLSFKEFRAGLHGLDGIKQQLRDIKVPANTFHIVGFLYDYDSLAEKPDREHIAAWSYPNPLFQKESFWEFPFSTTWPYFNDQGPFHENIHCLHRRCAFEGVQTQDTMDSSNTILGALPENLAQLTPYYPVITKTPSVITLLEQLLVALNALLVAIKLKEVIRPVLSDGLTPKPNPKIPESMQDMVKRVCIEEGLSNKLAEQLYKTVACESNFNPKAVNKNPNGTRDIGIIQANTYWYIGPGKPIPSEDVALNDPEFCVRVMALQFKKGRAKDWICWRKIFGNG